MPYVTFDKFLEEINATSTKLRREHHAGGQHIGLRHEGKYLPISVNESEFNFMQDAIIDDNLKCGFELSTGTGVSTIGIGRAFAQTSGSLISMDSYYEESSQKIAEMGHKRYNLDDIENIKKNSECYKFIDTVVKAENLPVDLQIGWSPEDVTKALEGKSVDFAFFDCPKSDLEFERDFTALVPFLNKSKFRIFVHDTHTFTQKSFDLVKSTLGLEMQHIYEYYVGTPHYKKWHYPMALITTK